MDRVGHPRRSNSSVLGRLKSVFVKCFTRTFAFFGGVLMLFETVHTLSQLVDPGVVVNVWNMLVSPQYPIMATLRWRPGSLSQSPIRPHRKAEREPRRRRDLDDALDDLHARHAYDVILVHDARHLAHAVSSSTCDEKSVFVLPSAPESIHSVGSPST